jgi:RNA polymerase sigma-70 factor (ECF subfamily)
MSRSAVNFLAKVASNLKNGCIGPLETTERTARFAADVTRMSSSQILGFTCGIISSMKERPLVKSVDEELVSLARSGNPKAFEELVERHKQKAYRIAFDFARDREEAKDLSQEAFLRAYTHLANFDGRSGFYTWFYRILVNVCLDYKRRKKRTLAEEFNETMESQMQQSRMSQQPPAPDQQVLAGQLSRKVSAALEALPPKQRTAFILKNNQGLSIKEIAAMMQTAEGTVKVHLHRAVTALRQSLAEFS